MDKKLLQCYNRGCGQKYQADNNSNDSCRHHPGEPFFHDAYKGWSCCNKKCIDFTEFLNIKGCAVSKHSNIKPPEPEKPVAKDTDVTEEVITVNPIVKKLKRPPFNVPMTTMTPNIAPSLKQQLTSKNVTVPNVDSIEIAIGTACKNGGCSTLYEGPQTNESTCVFHPGVPIFHEGMKFWSCCQKRTTDFNTFLSQVGCEKGNHVWRKETDDSSKIECRWDHHQTGTHVVVSIYAKQYCPTSSVIKLNPVRLYANLIFPEQGSATFTMDVELCGIVDVNSSQVNMYGTKVEIKLKKAEPGTWNKLEIRSLHQSEIESKVDCLTPRVEGVDLSDL